MHVLKFLSSLILCYCFGIHVEANSLELTDAANAKFELLLQRIELLENRNDKMERKLETIQKEFEMKERTLKERITKLERQNDLLKTDNENSHVSGPDKSQELREGHENMHKSFNTSEPSEVEMHFLEPKTNENRIADISKDQEQLYGQKKQLGSRQRRATEMEVAFFATVTPHDIEHLGVNQNIVFDNAVTNTGNAYHATHGIFTAPVDGTYVFCATVAGRHYANYKDYYANFDVNGKTVAKFITFPDEQSSQMIIVKLRIGDDVSIKNDHADDHILGAGWTSFSGFMLFQNFDSSVNVLGK